MAQPVEELTDEPIEEEPEDAPPAAAAAVEDDEEPGCTFEGGLARL